MRELPILFSAPMVRAILKGRKTQTRRIVKPQPSMYQPGQDVDLSDYINDSLVCPYGQPDDRLWVRENWQVFRPGSNDPLKGPMKKHPGGVTCTGFEATEDERCRDYPLAVRYNGPWRPSIHMPRWASRITLAVTGVRVERLQDISYEDALAEGAMDGAAFCEGVEPGKVNVAGETHEEIARRLEWPQRSFRELWESINGAGSWDANPWVWVVEFKHVEQERKAA